ncbi:MAG: PQQ-like beta-propeller repeat protein [Cytophagales bacterium]|nr:PQQ-like beta-propeller repeat protein [Cytophagales bacterium]
MVGGSAKTSLSLFFGTIFSLACIFFILLLLSCSDSEEGLPELIWERRLAGDVAHSFSAHGDHLFVVAQHGRLHAYTVGGRSRWVQDLHIDFCSPVGYGEHVYVGSEEGWLYQLDTLNGRIDWQLKVHGGVYGLILPSGDGLFATAQDGVMGRRGYVYALDLEGEEIWSYRTRSPIKSSLLSWKDVIIGIDVSGRVYALDKEGGSLLWEKSFGVAVHQDPILVGDRIFFSSDGGLVYGFSLDSREILWHYKTKDNISAPLFHFRDSLYIGDWNSEIYILSALTGDLLHNQRISGWINTGLCVDEGRLYIPNYHGFLEVLSVPDFSALWEIGLSGDIDMPIILRKKYLYLCTVQGMLYKFRVP